MKQLTPAFCKALPTSPSGKTPSGKTIPGGRDKVYEGLTDKEGLRHRMPHFSREDHQEASRYHDDERGKLSYKDGEHLRDVVNAHQAAAWELRVKPPVRRRSDSEKAQLKVSRAANAKAKEQFAKVTVHPGNAPQDLGKTGSGKPILGHLHPSYDGFERQTTSAGTGGQGNRSEERFGIEMARKERVRAANKGYTAQDHEDAASAHSAKKREKVSESPGRHDDLARAHRKLAREIGKALCGDLTRGAMAKAAPTFGSYQDAFQKLHDLSAAANSASSEDQHYAWSQYQRLFDLNHRNMDALQQLAAMRQLAQGR